MRPRRTTPQQDQEALSRAQFTEALALHGWRCEGFAEDLGEDHLVRIYSEGISTGLSFAVQLKSRSRLSTSIDAGTQLSHQFAVKDLLHWENAILPVVLVLWDVSKRSGVWRLVSDAIVELDGGNPDWRNRQSRKQKSAPTVAITFAKDKTCDKQGLDALRRTIATEVLPMVARGKELQVGVRFRFPETPAGAAVARAFDDVVSRGGAVHVPSSYVESISMSDWWTRMFGEIPAFTTALDLETLTSPRLLPISLRAETVAGRRAELPYIGLRATRGGTKEVTLSNADSASPVGLEIVRTVSNTTARMFLRYEPPIEGAGLDTVLAYAQFLECCAEGATLMLIPLEPEAGPSASGWLEPQQGLALPDEFLSLVRDLILIRDRLRLDVKLAFVTKGEDALVAEQVAEVIRTGKCTMPMEVTMHMRRTRLVDIQAHASFPVAMRTSRMDRPPFVLFGQQISLGEANVFFEGHFTEDNVARAINANPDDEFAPITVTGTGTLSFALYSGG